MLLRLSESSCSTPFTLHSPTVQHSLAHHKLLLNSEQKFGECEGCVGESKRRRGNLNKTKTLKKLFAPPFGRWERKAGKRLERCRESLPAHDADSQTGLWLSVAALLRAAPLTYTKPLPWLTQGADNQLSGKVESTLVAKAGRQGACSRCSAALSHPPFCSSASSFALIPSTPHPVMPPPPPYPSFPLSHLLTLHQKVPQTECACIRCLLLAPSSPHHSLCTVAVSLWTVSLKEEMHHIHHRTTHSMSTV